ncbi:8746_t:CDS:1, partial [Paraglomus occultum]
ELIKLPVSENALQHVKKFYYAEKAIQSEFIRQIEKCCTSIDEITTIQTSSTSTAFRQLAAFISRQKQLRKIEIRSTHALTNLSPLTRYLHQHRCSLTELVLSVGRLDEDALESIRECHNLERLTLHRIPLRSKHLRPVANAVFHSLRYLYVGDIDETWNVKSRDRPNNELITIIKLAKDTLDEIHLNVNLKYYNGLVKTIAGHCHKLKTFETCIQSTDQIQELFLLLKISQSLQTLSLSRRWNNVLFQSYRCILGIVNYIPKTLRRLDLKGMELGVSDVKMILDRCPHLMYMSWKCENFEREYENVVRKCAEKNARRVRKFGSKKLNERVRWMMEVEFEE